MSHWVDWAPSTGSHTGDCNSVPLVLSLSYAGASSSISFQDCEKYDVDIASTHPGDMSFNWHHGLSYPSGTREGAFNYIGAIGQGKTYNAHDYQKVAFWSPFYESGASCDDTDHSKNC
jgi:hypothetical protein